MVIAGAKVAGAKVAGGNLGKLFDAIGTGMTEACKDAGSNGVTCWLDGHTGPE